MLHWKTRCDRSNRELKAAIAEADAAVADLLVSLESTNAALKTPDKRVRTANSDRAAIEEPLTVVERMLAGAYAAREVGKDRAERERLATAIIARADRIDAGSRSRNLGRRPRSRTVGRRMASLRSR